jgi:hypothetical protein
MKPRSVAVTLIALAVGGALYIRHRDASGPAGSDRALRERKQDPALVLDRVWIDFKPEKYTDYAHAFLAVSYAPIGLFQKASQYQISLELFEFKRRAERLTLRFPQTGTQREIGFSIHACDDLPPFDLCLDLSENPWGGPRRYYGLADPDQESKIVGELRHRLEHALESQPPAR